MSEKIFSRTKTADAQRAANGDSSGENILQTVFLYMRGHIEPATGILLIQFHRPEREAHGHRDNIAANVLANQPPFLLQRFSH